MRTPVAPGGAAAAPKRVRAYERTLRELDQQLHELRVAEQERATLEARQQLLAEQVAMSVLWRALVPALNLNRPQQPHQQRQEQQQEQRQQEQQQEQLSAPELEPWSALLELVSAANAPLRALRTAGSAQVQAAAALSLEGYVDLYESWYRRLLEALELASPQRYTGLLAREEQAAAVAAVEALVDETYCLGTIISLQDLSNNTSRLIEAATLNLATRQAGVVPPASHFQACARRLKLTRQQVHHMRMLHEQYARMLQAEGAQGSSLVQQVATNSTSLQFAASQQQAAASGGSAAPAAASAEAGAGAAGAARAAAAAATTPAAPHAADAGANAAPGDLGGLLKAHMGSRLINAQLVGYSIASTLSKLQWAQLIVYSWPWHLSTTALAAAAVHLEGAGAPAATEGSSRCGGSNASARCGGKGGGSGSGSSSASPRCGGNGSGSGSGSGGRSGSGASTASHGKPVGDLWQLATRQHVQQRCASLPHVLEWVWGHLHLLECSS